MTDSETIEVNVTHLSNYRNRIVAKNHTIITDEPEESGGEGLAINPIELVLGAEGSCTVTVLMMFARKMKYDLSDVRIKLVHKRVRAEPPLKGYAHKIEKTVKFIGNLDEEQLEELKRVSMRCPVHKMLEEKTLFDFLFDHSKE